MTNTETSAPSSLSKLELFVALVERPHLRHLSFKEFVAIVRAPADKVGSLHPLRLMP